MADSNASAAKDPLIELQRMESALVRAELEQPGILAPADVRRLRYLLGFSRLTAFSPGAGGGGAGGRAEVAVGEGLVRFRSRVIDELRGPLRQESKPRDRLAGAGKALARMREPLAEERQGLIERHGGDFSAGELDAEVGRKALVNIVGGGGGAGFVYIGAYQRLQEAGIVPAYVIGASIGALLGSFRARAVAADWDDYIGLARSLDRRKLLSPVSIRRRYGLPGLLSLRLAPTVAPYFEDGAGAPLRICDLEIPYEAVVAGVRRPAFERLPEQFRDPSREGRLRRRGLISRYSPMRLSPPIVGRLRQVATFFDPRVVKPVVLGRDELTEQLSVVDAAGFSAAIPGVLHYDIEEEDERTDRLLDELFEREDVAALVDGGVVSNVPVELAWKEVQAGKLGTRNAFYLAFDCFHPQLNPGNLWLQPITQAVALQMNRNAPYADWVLRFDRTLSPLNLVPKPQGLAEAIAWGRSAVEERLPMIERFLEPFGWEE